MVFLCIKYEPLSDPPSLKFVSGAAGFPANTSPPTACLTFHKTKNVQCSVCFRSKFTGHLAHCMSVHLVCFPVNISSTTAYFHMTKEYAAIFGFF